MPGWTHPHSHLWLAHLVLFICVCLCVRTCMSGASAELWMGREGCALRHHSSSEMRNAIYSSAHPYWEKEEGIRWVSEFLPYLIFVLIAVLVHSVDALACPFCHSHHSFSLPICHSLHFCSWLNALCLLEINLFMSSFMYFHSDWALTLSLVFFVIYCLQYSTKG